jgi:hypothetical protein
MKSSIDKMSRSITFVLMFLERFDSILFKNYAHFCYPLLVYYIFVKLFLVRIKLRVSFGLKDDNILLIS